MAQDTHTGAVVYIAVGCANRPTIDTTSEFTGAITIFSFNPDTLDIRFLDEVNDIDNPTFLSFNPKTSCIYANSEVTEWREGTVSAYRLDPQSNRLNYINKQSTLGSVSAFNAITPDAANLLVANYAIGRGGPDQSLAILPIRNDGSLEPASGSAGHTGSGADPERQERSHAHCFIATRDGSCLIAADLGLDQLILYRRADNGELIRTAAFDMPTGSGPRHIAEHPDGRLLFVMNELNSTVATLTRDGMRLTLTDVQQAVSEGVQSYGADIHVSRDGRFVYASNRGHDSIAVFEVNPKREGLTLAGWCSTEGKWPRSFSLTPDNRFIVVANQHSHTLNVFSRNESDGSLSDTGKHVSIRAPMCVKTFTI